MIHKHIEKIAAELNLKPTQVQSAQALFAEGATVPFIARYRKEATGSLDEVALNTIQERLEQLAELEKRREAICKSLEERDLLTEELEKKIFEAETLSLLEDIYLPFRPKRRTRAILARERGLEELAKLLFAQAPGTDPEREAARFIDEEKGVSSTEDALAGARDIIAEWVNENGEAREEIRKLFMDQAVIHSKVIARKEGDAGKFKDYFDWKEPAMQAPSHRVLAMRRGENEKLLSLKVAPEEEKSLARLERRFVKGGGPASEQVRLAVQDAYKRLLSLSMETDIRLEMKKRADEAAIAVFAQNLRELLLAPPLGQRRVMAIDPGFRTGGKVVCLDAQGKLLDHDVIFVTQSKGLAREAEEKIKSLVSKHKIEAVAIGNGTGGRETEAFIRQIGLSDSIPVVMVNESGASIYSASETAREEFPDQDVTVRGSVSIGRRLMDPLAELVKIDPKSIGVGQYQHDVDQAALKKSLDSVVSSCVNRVGVEVNTASLKLLTYVSGLGPVLAKNIVDYRNENGPFASRSALKKVKRLGEKAFEQAAGFLRIRNGKKPLDASAVHPESYGVVEAMAKDLGCRIKDLLQDDSLRGKVELKRYISDKTGMLTLKDIMDELARPGLDPREKFEAFTFAEGVQKMEDLEPGMDLPGVVTNVTAFGAFVDVGVHQDGLVHISELSDRFVKDPSEVVRVHQKVKVRVLKVEIDRKRIALSMRQHEKGGKL